MPQIGNGIKKVEKSWHQARFGEIWLQTSLTLALCCYYSFFYTVCYSDAYKLHNFVEKSSKHNWIMDFMSFIICYFRVFKHSINNKANNLKSNTIKSFKMHQMTALSTFKIQVTLQSSFNVQFNHKKKLKQ